MNGFDLLTGLLVEGFRAAVLPCTLVVLIGGLAAAMAAREFAIPATVSFGLTVLALGWARFAGRIGDVNRFVLVAALLGAVAISVRPPIRRRDWLAMVAGFLVGLAVALMWVPCAGPALGQLVMDLPGRGLSGVVLLAFYLVGAVSPLLIFAAGHHLTADAVLERLEPIWSVAAEVLLVIMALAVAIGAHERVIGYLFALTLG